MKNKKDFTIVFEYDAFDREKTDASINTSKSVPLNEDLIEKNKIVEELDRFDLFENLKIDTSEYASKTSDAVYGIKYDRTVHENRGDVILPHQKNGAKRFLKELRGFGLLADVVGSGKTYEAGVVLSELAARDLVKSLLVIVPSQVFETWIEVLELRFGLGRGFLIQIRYNEEKPDSVNYAFENLNRIGNRPEKPVIIDSEAFENLNERYTSLLFDVVIVDEAHNLSQKLDSQNSMYLLSKLMETKRKSKVPYCVLLSATPHSGNLENMFKLWYFIRTKGGEPTDFLPNTKVHTTVYDKELEEYTEHICRGAHTVNEFIDNCRREIVLSEFRDDFDKYLEGKKFKGKFDALPIAEQKIYINDYYFDNDNGSYFADLKTKKQGIRTFENPIIVETSKFYYALLRTIMIRQENRLSHRRKKDIYNYYFYPVNEDNPTVEIRLQDFDAKRIIIAANYINKPGYPSVMVDDETITFDELYKRYNNIHKVSKSSFYSKILFGKVLNMLESKIKAFKMKNSITYYSGTSNTSYRNVNNTINFYNGLSKSIYDAKYEVLKDIINKNIDKRVIIFLDYEIEEKLDVRAKLEKDLANDFNEKQLILGKGNNKDTIIKSFNEDSTAILLIEDQAFTEGANLQKCNVIVNFQVTPDPLSMDQRIGRIFRLGQENDVEIYSLADMISLEGYILMYFNAIGLLSLNGGDATIIAGSNSERMVAVRCNRCNRVKLLSKDAYDQAKKNDSEILYCGTASCMKYKGSEKYGNKMEEITIYDFKCDRCNRVFTRSFADEGYICMSDVEGEKGRMCNSGKANDRIIYCNKICAMKHCERLSEINCKVIDFSLHPEEYCETVGYDKNQLPPIKPSDTVLDAICKECDNYMDCKRKGCTYEIGYEAILKCQKCDFATCRPRPHFLDFDENWNAKCPHCQSNRKNGTLRPTVAKTFATYVRNLWDFSAKGGDGYNSGDCFCDNLRNEINKVNDIIQILRHDEESKED